MHYLPTSGLEATDANSEIKPLVQLESTLETFIDVCPQWQRHRELYNLANEAKIFVQMLLLPFLQFCYPLSGRTLTGVLT